MTAPRWLTLLLALAWAAPALAGSVGAADLIANMQKAVAVVGREAQGGGANPGAPAQQPFFGALKQADSVVRSLATTFQTPGPAYFDALDQAGRAVGEVQVTFALSGISNPTIADAVQKLGQNYGVLRDNFSPEALRQRQGGQLSQKEASQFQQLQQKNQQLQVQLAALQQKVQGQADLGAQVEQMRQQSQVLASSQANLQGYLDGLRRASDLEARMRGLEQYARRNRPGVADDIQAASAGFLMAGFAAAAANAWRYGPPAWSYWNGYTPPNFNPTFNVVWNQNWGTVQDFQTWVQQSYTQEWNELDDPSSGTGTTDGPGGPEDPSASGAPDARDPTTGSPSTDPLGGGNAAPPGSGGLEGGGGTSPDPGGGDLDPGAGSEEGGGEMDMGGEE